MGMLLLCTLKSHAQQNDSATISHIIANENLLQNRMADAGYEMSKYRDISAVAIGMEGIGTILMVDGLLKYGDADQPQQTYYVGQNNNSQVNSAKTLIYIGAGAAAIGLIAHLISLDHIGKAAIGLKGNLISIPLSR